MTDSHEPGDEPLENEEDQGSPTSRKSGSPFKAGPFIVVALLVTIFALIQVQRKIMNRPDPQGEQGEEALSESTVGLTVQWDTQERLPLFEVPWRQGITVRDLMLSAQKAGKITFEEAGEEDAAMLTAISGTENEGGGTDSFNWTFEVNGTLADKSFAIYELAEGDIVLWKFGPYE